MEAICFCFYICFPFLTLTNISFCPCASFLYLSGTCSEFALHMASRQKGIKHGRIESGLEKSNVHAEVRGNNKEGENGEEDDM